MSSSCREPLSFEVVVVKGNAAVLEYSLLLEKLAERCCQSGAMHWLAHFFQVPSFKVKTAWLVLKLRSGADKSSLQLDDVRGAALLFEYTPWGIPTGAFSSDDWTGFRTVIAPEAEREAMAVLAAEAVLERGAQLVLVNYDILPERLQLPTQPNVAWAMRSRPIAKTLALENTIEGTLAKVGKVTRRNLRYYRRRVEATVPCEFVADAQGLIGEAGLQALNAGSLKPIPAQKFRRQYDSSWKLPGGFMLGLRALDGRWLSLIGGWRQADVTVLYWQMNTAGYEKLSLGTAMRHYFLEHEVSRGARLIMFYGGTPHSMMNSFLPEQATDLVMRRRSVRAECMCVALRLLSRCGIWTNSLLAQAIASPDLEWHTKATPQSGLSSRGVSADEQRRSLSGD